MIIIYIRINILRFNFIPPPPPPQSTDTTDDADLQMFSIWLDHFASAERVKPKYLCVFWMFKSC